jgi:hypothetical protein
MPWSNQVKDVPSSSEGCLIEEFDAAQVDSDGAFGRLTIIDQVQEKVPDFLLGQ